MLLGPRFVHAPATRAHRRHSLGVPNSVGILQPGDPPNPTDINVRICHLEEFNLKKSNMKKTGENDLGASAAPSGGTVQIGTVVAYYGKVVPDTWLLCDGKPIPAQYNTLIGMIGNSTPNLCGRTLIGSGTGQDSNGLTQSFALGGFGGEYTHRLNEKEIPAHSHNITYSFWSTAQGGGSGDSTNLRNSNEQKATTNTGGDGDHNNVQPYFVVNYIIYAGTN